jgi:hypothetical protein
MTSCSLGFSIIEENNKNNVNNSEAKNHLQQKRAQRNKTLKAPRKPVNEKVRSMMEVLHNNASDDEHLSDFNPPPKPMSMGNEKRKESDEKDESLNHEHFTAMTEGTYAQQYYNQVIPQVPQQHMAQPQLSGASNELVEKLNYMIHLLEEQHDEKVNNITEEIVLYSFLGVFVIFIVDSFVKVGKYIR